jgi:hypothetical protein
LLLGLLGALAVAPRPVQAQEFDLGVGADFWTEGNGVGLFTFVGLHRGASRPGSSSVSPGLLPHHCQRGPGRYPLDFKMRLTVGKAYVDGFAGPWFFFKGTAVRAHVGVGAAKLGRILLGGEVSYLISGATFGGRLTFEL